MKNIAYKITLLIFIFTILTNTAIAEEKKQHEESKYKYKFLDLKYAMLFNNEIKYTVNTEGEDQNEKSVSGSKYSQKIAATIKLPLTFIVSSLYGSLRAVYTKNKINVNKDESQASEEELIDFKETVRESYGGSLIWIPNDKYLLFKDFAVDLSYRDNKDNDRSDALKISFITAISKLLENKNRIGIGVLFSKNKFSSSLFPIIDLEWHIRDDLIIKNPTSDAYTRRSGLELVYKPDQKKYETAIGWSYKSNSFLNTPTEMLKNNKNLLFARLKNSLLKNSLTIDLLAGLELESKVKDQDDNVKGVFDRSFVLAFSLKLSL